MKNVLVLIFVIAVCSFSCKKEDVNIIDSEPSRYLSSSYDYLTFQEIESDMNAIGAVEVVPQVGHEFYLDTSYNYTECKLFEGADNVQFEVYIWAINGDPPSGFYEAQDNKCTKHWSINDENEESCVEKGHTCDIVLVDGVYILICCDPLA
jgi:hypothetical protein